MAPMDSDGSWSVVVSQWGGDAKTSGVPQMPPLTVPTSTWASFVGSTAIASMAPEAMSPGSRKVPSGLRRTRPAWVIGPGPCGTQSGLLDGTVRSSSTSTVGCRPRRFVGRGRRMGRVGWNLVNHLRHQDGNMMRLLVETELNGKHQGPTAAGGGLPPRSRVARGFSGNDTKPGWAGDRPGAGRAAGQRTPQGCEPGIPPARGSRDGDGLRAPGAEAAPAPLPPLAPKKGKSFAKNLDRAKIPRIPVAPRPGRSGDGRTGIDVRAAGIS